MLIQPKTRATQRGKMQLTIGRRERELFYKAVLYWEDKTRARQPTTHPVFLHSLTFLRSTTAPVSSQCLGKKTHEIHTRAGARDTNDESFPEKKMNNPMFEKFNRRIKKMPRPGRMPPYNSTRDATNALSFSLSFSFSRFTLCTRVSNSNGNFAAPCRRCAPCGGRPPCGARPASP